MHAEAKVDSNLLPLGSIKQLTKYQFGTAEEVMTANIQQVGENLLGSFSVQPSSGDKYSGIIFGTVRIDG